MIRVRVCIGCDVPKPLGLFSSVGNGTMTARCLVCLATARRVRRAANPELDRANEQRWYASHAQFKRGQKRAHYWADPERWREWRREYGQRPEAKALHALQQAVRRARIEQATIVVFTFDQLSARLSMWAGCWMCGAPWTDVDHVKPIVAGGPHCLANMRPACDSCNSRKQGLWFGVRWAHALAARNGGQ